MDIATLMGMLGQQGAGQAGMAGALGPQVVAGAPTVLPTTGTAPALGQMGSGTFGVMDSVPAITQMGTAGPMGVDASAQGMGPLMGNSFMPTEDNLNKLANAPLDPAKILQLLSQKHAQGGGSFPGAGPAGRGVDKMQEAHGGQLKGNRPGLAQFLGK